MLGKIKMDNHNGRKQQTRTRFSQQRIKKQLLPTSLPAPNEVISKLNRSFARASIIITSQKR